MNNGPKGTQRNEAQENPYEEILQRETERIPSFVFTSCPSSHRCTLSQTNSVWIAAHSLSQHGTEPMSDQ